MKVPFAMIVKPAQPDLTNEIFDRELLRTCDISLSDQGNQILFEGVAQKDTYRYSAMALFDFVIAVDDRANLKELIYQYMGVTTFFSELFDGCTLYKMDLHTIYIFLVSYNLDTQPKQPNHGVTLLHNWLYTQLKGEYGFLFEGYTQRMNTRSQTFLLEKRR